MTDVTVEVDHQAQTVTIKKAPRLLVGPAPTIVLTYADWLKATAVVLAYLSGGRVEVAKDNGQPT